MDGLSPSRAPKETAIAVRLREVSPLHRIYNDSSNNHVKFGLQCSWDKIHDNCVCLKVVFTLQDLIAQLKKCLFINVCKYTHL